jgi:stage V sporulation protein G
MSDIGPAAAGSLAITEVRVRLHRGGPDDILRAFASITLNDCFAVHNLKVIDKDEGPFVSMPARKNRDGAFSDIAHPINREFREYMESVVLTEYERELQANR